RSYDIGASTVDNYDFDMALRMIPINMGSGDPDIYVTGSCNSAYNGIYGSATLSLIIDRNTLTTIYNNPFIELYGEGERPYEYGIDAFQSDDGIYVVSNNFLPFPNLGYGFNVDARRTSITYVDNSLNTF